MRLIDIASRKDRDDTVTKNHKLFDLYEPYFAPLRTLPVKMLELGVHKGESLKIFASYFENGRIVGVDIQDYELDFSHVPNVVFEQADQRDGKRLEELSAEHAPEGWDIILDDASHYGSWSLKTFQSLFAKLKPGGLYVVEDWISGYWDDWPDGQRYQRMAFDVPKDHIPPRLPSHDSGMVGFIKLLVDELAHRPVGARGSDLPLRISSTQS